MSESTRSGGRPDGPQRPPGPPSQSGTAPQPGSTYPGAAPYPGAPPQGSYGTPYPGTGSPGGPPPERPGAVRLAVWLMIAGAVLSVVSVVVVLAVGDLRAQVVEQLEGQGTEVTSEVVDVTVAVAIVTTIVTAVVSAALWLWMAWKNGQGRGWARIVATILAGLNVLFSAISYSGVLGAQSAAYGPVEVALGVVNVVIGVVVVVLLWLGPSRAYFDAVAADRAARQWAPGR